MGGVMLEEVLPGCWIKKVKIVVEITLSMAPTMKAHLPSLMLNCPANEAFTSDKVDYGHGLKCDRRSFIINFPGPIASILEWPLPRFDLGTAAAIHQSDSRARPARHQGFQPPTAQG